MSRLLQSRSRKEAIGDEKKSVEEIVFLGFTVCRTGKQYIYIYIFKINIFGSTGK